MRTVLLVLVGVVTMLAGCGDRRPASPTATDAAAFLKAVDDRLLQLAVGLNQAGWVQQNFITVDTEAINAAANKAFIEAVAQYAKDAVKFDGLELPADQRRQLDLLRLSLVMATPNDQTEATELTTIAARMDGAYGRAKWCQDPKDPGSCLDEEAIIGIMANSRDPKRLRAAWEGWHATAIPMRKDYEKFVELSNKGAKELGFPDTGAMWRSKYDLPPDAFAAEMDRLWDQVRPLYLSLHAYMRMKLRERYGEVVPDKGPIPAYLLGNIWAQSWENLYPDVAPTTGARTYDLTKILQARKTTPIDMVKYGERFFVSLGLAPLPQTFYERSLLTKPRDREVVCHASAWSIDLADDLRIKMCIDATAEDFTVIHHELGHNFYQRAYKDLPMLFRDSANDGFHEALGDTIGLSVTPEYLVKVGLIGQAPDASGDTGLLLQQALAKIAFLPFGLLVDQWRWQVFSGQVTPANYNRSWWALRLKYQGVAPPEDRGETFFDPGAKYHVPGNTPYARYFLAHILQFQFHRALSQAAGCTAPLHRCSIYESKAAGERLNKMMAMGLSRPWPEALEALTGSKQMDATAILDYFAPLQKWLDEQVKGKPVGW
ncbi:MAG TPA: M2 family metallopeptidase [Vicinamibacterales bacterium]|nr:M2 family metallopeptidase [Vicinamibacterales bacterium]